jgi:hypothetical protein
VTTTHAVVDNTEKPIHVRVKMTWRGIHHAWVLWRPAQGHPAGVIRIALGASEQVIV